MGVWRGLKVTGKEQDIRAQGVVRPVARWRVNYQNHIRRGIDCVCIFFTSANKNGK